MKEQINSLGQSHFPISLKWVYCKKLKKLFGLIQKNFRGLYQYTIRRRIAFIGVCACRHTIFVWGCRSEQLLYESDVFVPRTARHKLGEKYVDLALKAFLNS